MDSNECPGDAAPKPAREACSTCKCPCSLPQPAQRAPLQGAQSPDGHLQVELDPVAESSEEAEAASGSSELGPVPSQESRKPELLGPEAEASGQGLRSR